MKTLLTIILFSFCFTISFGQLKIDKLVIYSKGDSLWYKYQQNVIKNLSLLRIDTSSSTYYFRLWKENQIVDIWKNIDDSFSGQLTTWVTEQTPVNEKHTGRIHISKNQLNNDTVHLIKDLIEKAQPSKLLTDDSIKGWKQGFDGVTYTIEFASKSQYDFKTYWTPQAQDSSLQEAKFIQSFIDNIFQSCNANFIWREFQNTIPFECYTYGGVNVCKVVSRKKRKKFVAERKRYLKQNL